MKEIEQIFGDKVVLDFDKKLSKTQIIEVLKKDFGVLKNNKNPYECFVNKDIKLFVKQITYLGNPHPIFKKRIQISKGWEVELK